MIRRSTWIVVAIFLVLLGFLLYWQYWQPAASADAALTAAPTVEAKAPIFDLPADSTIVGVRVEGAAGNFVVVTREDEESEWDLLEPPHPDKTDNQKVQTMVDQLVAMRESSSLEAAPSLDVTGLESPSYTITLTLQNGQQKKLFIGDKTITGNTYYVRVEGGTPQVVNQYSVDAALNMLTNLPLLPTPTPEPES